VPLPLNMVVSAASSPSSHAAVGYANDMVAGHWCACGVVRVVCGSARGSAGQRSEPRGATRMEAPCCCCCCCCWRPPRGARQRRRARQLWPHGRRSPTARYMLPPMAAPRTCWMGGRAARQPNWGSRPRTERQANPSSRVLDARRAAAITRYAQSTTEANANAAQATARLKLQDARLGLRIQSALRPSGHLNGQATPRAPVMAAEW
jgi:hypothetical protein